MAARKRPRIKPTDDRQLLRLCVGFPEQGTCELLRPIVLFRQMWAVRAYS